LPISGDVETYVAVPPGQTMESVMSGKADKIVLWCADVYGPRFVNNQLLMDWMASQGEIGYLEARIICSSIWRPPPADNLPCIPLVC
jgi:hypothetical protein